MICWSPGFGKGRAIEKGYFCIFTSAKQKVDTHPRHLHSNLHTLDRVSSRIMFSLKTMLTSWTFPFVKPHMSIKILGTEKIVLFVRWALWDDGPPKTVQHNVLEGHVPSEQFSLSVVIAQCQPVQSDCFTYFSLRKGRM